MRPAASVPATGGAHGAGWRWVLLLALVLAAYGPSLRADFVNWDDPVHVYENLRVTAPDALRRGWSDGRMPGFYPVLYGLYRLEWRAADHRPWLFHLDNVLLHAASALLVALLAQDLAVPPLAAWLAAALWALHPAHVESVAWVTERKNVLYVLFWLGSLRLYLRWRRADPPRGPLTYGASLLLFVLSLLSKGAAMTLPAALVLVEWTRARRLDRRFWVSLAPYVALGLAGGVGLVRLVPASIRVPPLADRLAVACRAFWFYLGTFLWPHPLVPVYPKWQLGQVGAPEVLAGLGLAALAALCVAARRHVPRIILFGAGLFVTNVFLILGVVWNSYTDIAFVADRYLYLPGVGLAIAAVAGLRELARRAGLSTRVPTVAVAAWIGALAVVTWRQVPVWHDSDALWAYTLAHNPDCAECHDDLGVLLLERGDLAGATEHLVKAIRLEPSYSNAHYNLGVVLEREGKTDEAIARYQEAERLNPERADVHNNLGVALLHAERAEEARTQFEATLRLHPDDVEALLNLGVIASADQDWAAAERRYRAALAVATEDKLSAAHSGLGVALLKQHKLGDAIAHYEAALRLAPDDADLLGALAWVRATGADAQWRDGAQAVRLAERACVLTDHRDANALDTLAAAYAEAGRFADAVRTQRQALDAAGADVELAEEMRARLALYEAHEPYRTP